MVDAITTPSIAATAAWLLLCPVILQLFSILIINCMIFPQINEDVGYWRAFGFGIVAMYKSDLKAVGGLDTSILGWGGEDVDLYEKVHLYCMPTLLFNGQELPFTLKNI